MFAFGRKRISGKLLTSVVPNRQYLASEKDRGLFPFGHYEENQRTPFRRVLSFIMVRWATLNGFARWRLLERPKPHEETCSIHPRSWRLRGRNLAGCA